MSSYGRRPFVVGLACAYSGGMEDYDKFKLSHRGVRRWLLAVAVFAGLLTYKFEGAVWGLCVAGGIALLAGKLAYDHRTGVHATWDRDPEFEPPLDWFEGWAVSTGAVLVIVPLSFVLLMSWIGT